MSAKSDATKTKENCRIGDRCVRSFAPLIFRQSGWENDDDRGLLRLLLESLDKGKKKKKKEEGEGGRRHLRRRGLIETLPLPRPLLVFFPDRAIINYGEGIAEIIGLNKSQGSQGTK